MLGHDGQEKLKELKMRKIKITKIDNYGFCGRERHPSENMIGLNAIVIRSHYENFEDDHSSVNDSELMKFGIDLEALLRDGVAYEVVEAYVPELDLVVTLVDHEFKEVK